MPIPIPETTESEREFIARCMGNETMVQDFEDNAQRYAICIREFNKEAPMDTAPMDGEGEQPEEETVEIPFSLFVELVMNQKPKV